MIGSWAISICPGWPTVVLWDSNYIMNTKKPWRQFKKLKRDSDVLQVAGMPPDVFSSFTELEGYPHWQVPVRRLFHCSLLKSVGQGAFFLPEASKYFTGTWCPWMRGRWWGVGGLEMEWGGSYMGKVKRLWRVPIHPPVWGCKGGRFRPTDFYSSILKACGVMIWGTGPLVIRAFFMKYSHTWGSHECNPSTNPKKEIRVKPITPQDIEEAKYNRTRLASKASFLHF